MEIYQKDRQQKLISKKDQQALDEAQRAWIFHLLGDPNTSALANTNAPAASPAPQNIVITSKGIPVQPRDYNTPINPPDQQSTSTSTYYPELQESSTTTAAINTKASAKVEGDLVGRTLLKKPVVISQHRDRGKVVIKICVDERGEVISAKFTQRGSTTFNSELKEIALHSARATRFDTSSLTEQCGTIAYHFK